jgi:asparagine synthetase B (glutamine-hydrolysing)
MTGFPLHFDLAALPAGHWESGDVRVDSDGAVLKIERPRHSTQPIFTRRQGGFLTVGTAWDSLLGAGGDALDLGYVKDYLRFQTPHTRRTFARNISLLGHGENIFFSKLAERRETLEREGSDSPPAELNAALTEALGGAEKACFHLSSGLDSSLLALISRRMGRKVVAATLRTRGRGASDELSDVERLADHAGISLRVFDFREMDIWREGQRLVEILGYPIAHPSHLVRFVLDRAIVEGRLGDRIVTGRGPDEVLGGYATHGPDFFDASRHLDRIRCTKEPWIAALFAETEDGEAISLHGTFADKGTMTLERRLSYDQGAIFEAWNIVEADFSRGLGIEYLNPFLRPGIAAMLMGLPDHEKVRGGEQKVFLRRIFRDLYPEFLLSAPKRGLTIDLREYMLGESVAGIVDRIWTASEFAPRVLNRGALLRLVDETLGGSANHGWQIWSLYLCSLTYPKLSEKLL